MGKKIHSCGELTILISRLALLGKSAGYMLATYRLLSSIFPSCLVFSSHMRENYYRPIDRGQLKMVATSDQ